MQEMGVFLVFRLPILNCLLETIPTSGFQRLPRKRRILILLSFFLLAKFGYNMVWMITTCATSQNLNKSLNFNKKAGWWVLEVFEVIVYRISLN